MNRNNLISLIVLDVIVMMLAIGLMFYRYQSLAGIPVSTVAAQQGIKNPEPATVKTEAVKSEPPKETRQKVSDQPARPSEARNISFTYKNSIAKKVEVIGDFTEWIPIKMSKGASHTWKLNVTLAPGDYAYNFVIDSKPKRDPNNPKVCNAGRGFPNSFLKVKALNEDSAQ